MSDLSELQAAQTVKIAGAGAASGVESNFVEVDASGRMQVRSVPAGNSLTAASPSAASIGIASGTLLATNANRKGLVLTNTSIAKISIGLGVTAVLNSGITLYPGGTWVMDELTFTTAQLNAIASIAASNVAIQEFS